MTVEGRFKPDERKALPEDIFDRRERDMGLSIIVPVFNQLDNTRHFIDYLLKYAGEKFELIIIDNASTDGTDRFFADLDMPDLVYIRNDNNLGIVKGFNQGAALAKYDLLVFMHNDLFIFDALWMQKVSDFFTMVPHAGVAGIYGHQRFKKDGSPMHRSTVIFDKTYGFRRKKLYYRAAVLDGMCLMMTKTVFRKIEGFDENLIMYYYDFDISLEAVSAGYENYVLRIPFYHKGKVTRGSDEFIQEVGPEKEIMGRMRHLFLNKWSGRIPYDTRNFFERLLTPVIYELRRLLSKIWHKRFYRRHDNKGSLDNKAVRHAIVNRSK